MELRPRSTRSKGPTVPSAAASVHTGSRACPTRRTPRRTRGLPSRPPRPPPHGARPRRSGARGSRRCTSPLFDEDHALGHGASAVYTFISRSTPRRTSRPPSRRIDSATGTCLTSAAIRSGDPRARVTGAGLAGVDAATLLALATGPGCSRRLNGRWRHPRGCTGPTPTWRCVPRSVRTEMIWAHPTATGSKARIGCTRCPRAASPSIHGGGASDSTTTVRSSPHQRRNGPAEGASSVRRGAATAVAGSWPACSGRRQELADDLGAARRLPWRRPGV